MKIYIDSNYPRPVLRLLEDIHALQDNNHYQIRRWDNDELHADELNDAIFLVVDYQKKGISIPIQKQVQDGYKTVVYKVVNEKVDRFEFAMTVLRVWPHIIEKSRSTSNLFSFKYGGKKLSVAKIKNE